MSSLEKIRNKIQDVILLHVKIAPETIFYAAKKISSKTTFTDEGMDGSII